jgi:ABC-type nitrate/sulfonate/bicarbonate transport system substrate-binding protein
MLRGLMDTDEETLKDLYGKKVAFQSGAIGQQMFIELCTKEGLDISKVDIVFLNNVDMAAAVGSKTVDAIVTWEPQPSLLESKGLVTILQRGGKYLKSPGCVIFGTGFIKSNRDAVLRFTKRVTGQTGKVSDHAMYRVHGVANTQVIRKCRAASKCSIALELLHSPELLAPTKHGPEHIA